MFKHVMIGLAAMSLAVAPVAAETLTPVTSGYAPVNGVEIYYETYGSGEPLILLHGGLESIVSYAPIIPALAEGRQVIALDLQGHGRTEPFDRPMTWSNLAADVAGVIRHFGYEKADVMGYSMGGITALRTAIEHPEVVDDLVLVSAPFSYGGWHTYNAEGMKTLSGAMAEEMKQTPMYERYVAQAKDPSLWPKTLDQTGALTGADFDWSAEIGKIEAPTLLVYGDYDSVRISHAVEFFERLGGGKVDGGWQGEGMTPNRLAVLQGTVHYFIFGDLRLADEAVRFLDQS